MGAFFTKKKIFVWWAVFTVLLASLAPTISRLLADRDTSLIELIEVCTVDGLKQLPASLFDNDNKTPPKPLVNHCPFCATHAGSFGLIPEVWEIAAFGDSIDQPVGPIPLPRARSVYLPIQARAPPPLMPSFITA